MKTTLLVVAVVALAMGLSFRESVAGTPTMWVLLGAPYVLLSGLALRKLANDGTLMDVLRPKAGDFSVGFLIAGVLYGGGWIVRHFVLTNHSSKFGWLLRLSFQLGGMKPSPGLLGIVLFMAVLEELVWRGLVLTSLSESLGSRRAPPAAAIAYALAHVPTIFTLADPIAGPNPALVFAAFGCGLVWSFGAQIAGRLPPIVVSHAIFSYFAFATLLPRFG